MPSTTTTHGSRTPASPQQTSKNKINNMKKWPYIVLIFTITALAITLMVVPSKLMNAPIPGAALDLDTTFATLVRYVSHHQHNCFFLPSHPYHPGWAASLSFRTGPSFVTVCASIEAPFPPTTKPYGTSRAFLYSVHLTSRLLFPTVWKRVAFPSSYIIGIPPHDIRYSRVRHTCREACPHVQLLSAIPRHAPNSIF